MPIPLPSLACSPATLPSSLPPLLFLYFSHKRQLCGFPLPGSVLLFLKKDRSGTTLVGSGAVQERTRVVKIAGAGHSKGS